MMVICFIFLVYLSSISDSIAQSWTKKADFPGLRYKAVGFSIGDKGYVGTGLSPDSVVSDFWQYDPITNTWQQKPSFPGRAVHGAIGFSINGKGYIGGGVTDTSGFARDLWEYDPQSDSWTKKADLPFVLGAQFNLVSFSIRNKGYVLGTFNDDNFWEYDPSIDKWSKKGNFSGPADIHESVGLSIGNKGYIGTGITGFNSTSEFWEYDPDMDSWDRKTDFPGLPRGGAVGFSILDKGYIGLGNTGGKLGHDFWAYDPAANSWTEIDSCLYGAHGAFAFSIGTKGYIGTGIFAPTGEFWEYDSEANSVEHSFENSVNSFSLQQNYPNPFNPSTTIPFSLPIKSNVLITLYDALGREVAKLVDEEKTAGNFMLEFNASNLSSGIYYYQMKTTDYIQTRKMLLLR